MRKGHTTGLDSDEGNVSFWVPFGKFMGDPPHRSAYRLPIH
jgi:hypothetical protein